MSFCKVTSTVIFCRRTTYWQHIYLRTRPETKWCNSSDVGNTVFTFISKIWCNLFFNKTKYLIWLSSPHGVQAFHELRRYPGPSDSIVAKKMYILEKCILGTHISMLGFFFENSKNYQAQLFFVLRFPLRSLKTA